MILFGMIAYVLAQFAVGIWVSRRVKSEADYILAGRSLGPTLVAFSVFATWFGAEAIVATTAEVYDKGISGALVDHQTVDLSRYERVLGVDHARFEGRLRSDKAIGGPLLAAPFYAVGRAFGFESAEDLRANGDVGMWWTTLWTSLVPFTILLVVMYQFVRRFAPNNALIATLAMGFGTMMLPHAVNLYGHVLAALCGFGAYVAADRASPSAARLMAGAPLRPAPSPARSGCAPRRGAG